MKSAQIDGSKYRESFLAAESVEEQREPTDTLREGAHTLLDEDICIRARVCTQSISKGYGI